MNNSSYKIEFEDIIPSEYIENDVSNPYYKYIIYDNSEIKSVGINELNNKNYKVNKNNDLLFLNDLINKEINFKIPIENTSKLMQYCVKNLMYDNENITDFHSKSSLYKAGFKLENIKDFLNEVKRLNISNSIEVDLDDDFDTVIVYFGVTEKFELKEIEKANKGNNISSFKNLLKEANIKAEEFNNKITTIEKNKEIDR